MQINIPQRELNAELIWAAYNGHVQVVTALLEAGANVHAYDDYALRYAAYNGHVQIVTALLEAGADVHADNDCALRWAAEYGHDDVIAVLNRYGAKGTLLCRIKRGLKLAGTLIKRLQTNLNVCTKKRN